MENLSVGRSLVKNLSAVGDFGRGLWLRTAASDSLSRSRSLIGVETLRASFNRVTLLESNELLGANDSPFDLV